MGSPTLIWGSFRKYFQTSDRCFPVFVIIKSLYEKNEGNECQQKQLYVVGQDFEMTVQLKTVGLIGGQNVASCKSIRTIKAKLHKPISFFLIRQFS